MEEKYKAIIDSAYQKIKSKSVLYMGNLSKEFNRESIDFLYTTLLKSDVFEKDEDEFGREYEYRFICSDTDIAIVGESLFDYFQKLEQDYEKSKFIKEKEIDKLISEVTLIKNQISDYKKTRDEASKAISHSKTAIWIAAITAALLLIQIILQ